MATKGMAVGRRVQRPSGAYKLLTSLLYGNYPYLMVGGTNSMDTGLVAVLSLRKLARCLGTETSRVNRWLTWLEDMGYIESLSYSPNRREAYMRLRRPRNVR